MNKAITDGVIFMPPAFAAGNLAQFSRGDGVPGSDTYASFATAAFVPADQDFGGCLELQKTDGVQKLRYMGQTPIVPGCYLRVTARVKAVAGALPEVRIAAWAGDIAEVQVTGIDTVGASVPIPTYGEIVEVSAIVGVGARNGVDFVWGTTPVYGHFGVDLTGANGGVVRIDDLVIEDVTEVFLRDMMNWVDVRDYGAIGDGITDDSAAFGAANAAAEGRRVLVSKGTYYLGSSVTLTNRVQFEGRLDMPDTAILALTKDFSLPTYIDAFGGDEERAFQKAVQALLNNTDHESLDLGGRRVSVYDPIDVQAAVPGQTSIDQRRVIRNGQLRAESSGSWAPQTVTSQASYSASTPFKLTGVQNVANIAVGSLVEAPVGVGREVYVKQVNLAAEEVELSQPLSDAAATQTYTFTRYQYLLDLSGFARVDLFELDGIEFQCGEQASGVILPRLGQDNVLRNCVVNRPGHRGITSIGEGCQGLQVEQCQFISHEGAALAQLRDTVAINTNADDVKLLGNRASQFRHFAVLSGAHTIVSGNHVFQGDQASIGTRTAGVVLCQRACNTQITGNYFDNCLIEWTNEREPEPDFSGGFGFAGLAITNNVMLSSDVSPSFSYIVVKPYGVGHFVSGLTVTGNTFRCIGGTIERVERIDTSVGQIDKSQMRAVHMLGNTFHNVDITSANPLLVTHDQNTPAQVWEVNGQGGLPFEGQALAVESLVSRARPTDTSGASRYDWPYVQTQIGAAQDRIQVIFGQAIEGSVTAKIRMDL